jgi:hypothetical protein
VQDRSIRGEALAPNYSACTPTSELAANAFLFANTRSLIYRLMFTSPEPPTSLHPNSTKICISPRPELELLPQENGPTCQPLTISDGSSTLRFTVLPAVTCQTRPCARVFLIAQARHPAVPSRQKPEQPYDHSVLLTQASKVSGRSMILVWAIVTRYVAAM